MVARAFFTAVAICMRDRYVRLVGPYVSRIPLFNTILLRYGAIISGSNALRFLMPLDTWVPNDLDIYVSDTKFSSLLTALTDPLGLNFKSYRSASSSGPNTPEPRLVPDFTAAKAPLVPFADEDSDSPRDGRDGSSSQGDTDTGYASDDSGRVSPLPPAVLAKGLRDVRTLYTPSGRRVDVIRSPSNSPITPLRFFWSTAVMNFMTPNAYVCGYPVLTLDRLGILKHGKLRPRDKAAIAKYEGRGYHFIGEEWRDMMDTWDYLFFGQREALVIDFRLRIHDPTAVLPIKKTSRGWVPSLDSTLPRPGERRHAYVFVAEHELIGTPWHRHGFKCNSCDTGTC